MKPFRSIESIRNESEMRSAEQAADVKRGDFLRALDASDVEVSDWEARFLDGFLFGTSNRPSDEPSWWTEGRRAMADRLARKYPSV